MALQRPLPVSGAHPPDGYARVAGVVHVHTTHSDGGGTPEDVVAAAKAAGLGFVAITDHNNLDAKAVEGYRDGVLVVVGTEVSTAAGHVLGLGIPDPAFRFSGDAQDALEDIRDLGGAAFAAHPLSPRPDFRWGGWELPGAWGLELLNGDSQWRDAGWGRLSLTAALYRVNPRYALLRSLSPVTATVERWDRLLASRHAPGIVGSDAHSRVPLGKSFAPRFPSYESVFLLAQNHVLVERPLSGDASRDIRSVVEALAHGRSYVALDALAPAGGFSFTADAGGRRYTMGETAPASSPVRLRAGGRLPAGATLRLLKDGSLERSGSGALDVIAPGPGVYRVEGYVPGSALPWILTNPIYVFGADAEQARAGRGAWPADPVAPTASMLLEAFDDTTSFAAEFDPSSNMETDVVSPAAGPDGSSAGRLAFRLGAPGPGRPYVWCALVSRQTRDLSGRRGLVFSLKGDGVYRLWVQLRDSNPASADAGEEWWFASVKTTTNWRRVAVPFARLRSINPRSDGRLDLDKLRAIVFVLDAGSLKPGTAGVIALDDVATY